MTVAHLRFAPPASDRRPRNGSKPLSARRRLLGGVGALLLFSCLGKVATADTPLAGEMVVVKDAAHPQTGNHSSAIIELPSGDLLCLWNHTPQSKLGYGDIVSSRLPFGSTTWTPMQTLLSAPNRAYINPSLCFDADHVLWMFYAVSNESWLYLKSDGTPNDENMQNSCMYYRKSYDYGATWGEPNLVRGRMNTGGQAGYLTGAKPILLKNGNLMVSTYRDYSTQTSTSNVWTKTDSLGLVTADNGRSFSESNAIYDGLAADWIAMPSIQQAADGTVLIWYRTPNSKAGGQMFRGTASSTGLSWAQPSIPSNSPNGSQARLDTLKLQSGKYLLACTPGGRAQMQFLLSSNDGSTWDSQRVTDSLGGGVTVSPGVYTGTVAYPSVVQSRDGLIHAAYTYDGYHQIKHVVLSEAWLAGGSTTYRPSVGIAAPLNGAYFTSPSVSISAVARDQDGSVAKVEFYEDASKLGELTASPYTWTQTFASGVHHVSARAIDNAGNSTTSATIRFTVAAAAGVLTGSVVSGSSAAVNLTDEGTLDWIHLGLGNSATARTRRNSPALLGDVTALGQTPIHSYNDSPVHVSWSNGDPTATVGSTGEGIYIDYMGSGFEVTAPADTTTRRLKLYVGTYLSRGRCDAWLSDGNAARFVDTSVQSTGGTQTGVYTLDYRAATAGQSLTVRFMQDYNFGSNSFPGAGSVGNVAVQAVSLSSVGGSGLPGTSGGGGGSGSGTGAGSGGSGGGHGCGLLGLEALALLAFRAVLRRRN
jgi:predicted neuraminidase